MAGLSREEKLTLLSLARKTIEEYLLKGRRVKIPEVCGSLTEKRGAFVTLNKSRSLRGCIGNMIGTMPLIETIREMAIAAATEDPRFPSMSSDELNDIRIEISVLSPLKRIEDVGEIDVGKHGILMRKGFYQGVLLPQVAVEYGWDRKAFLEQTCIKAGLPPDAWKDPKTTLEIFTTEKFSEKDLVR